MESKDYYKNLHINRHLRPTFFRSVIRNRILIDKFFLQKEKDKVKN